MKTYNITVNGKLYQVAVEEVGVNAPAAIPQPMAATPVQLSAPTPAVPAASPTQEAPKAAPAVQAAPPAGATNVTAPMPGNIINIAASVGSQVKEGELLLILEAMKMENEILAPVSGTVAAISVTKGSTVNSGDILVSIS